MRKHYKYIGILIVVVLFSLTTYELFFSNHVIYVQSKKIHIIDWDEDGVNVLNQVIKGANDPLRIYFLPQEYSFDNAIEINNKLNVSINGFNLFHKKSKWIFDGTSEPVAILSSDVFEGDKKLTVNNDELEIGQKYQIYKQNKKGDRILEFTPVLLGEGEVEISKPVAFMQHVEEVLKGDRIYRELNFINIESSKSVSVNGIHMDGQNIGEVRGHTMYSGVIATKPYNSEVRSVQDFITITNCSFRNFKGRGVVFYGYNGVEVSDSTFNEIATEAIELDHYTTGKVLSNKVSNAAVAIQLNDAYSSLVKDNYVYNNQHGVMFVSHYDDPTLNTLNIVENNTIIGSSKIGLKLSKESHENSIVENSFSNNKVDISGNTTNNIIKGNKIINE